MRFFETQNLERIGFDFYCDIANNLVKARKAKEWTQKELAKQSGIKNIVGRFNKAVKQSWRNG